MRVAFIAHTNSPWTPHYSKYLHARGHEVHVVSFHSDPIPDAIVHYVGPSAGGLAPKWMYFSRIPGICRLIKQIAPDVVMATYFQSNGLVGAMSKCSPLIVSTRGPDYHFWLPSLLSRRIVLWIAGRADLLHASSPEHAEALIAMGVPPHKFRVFPMGTDPTDFTPPDGPRPAGPLRIICTRKHEALYDNETVIRALALLKNRGMEFQARFVGTGSLLKAGQDLAAQLGLQQTVQFIGEVPHRDVANLLRWADIYVSASTADGAASSLFEAMAVRLFPVVTDIRANRDWLEDRRNSCLFKSGNAEECADGIEYAACHPQFVATALDSNREVVITRANRLANLARLESLLCEAAAIRVAH